MENSYNNLLEEAYSCLASKNYKKAINIFERILETDKNSYEALFGLILAQNKCSSKELFLNDIELVSSNIDSLDKVIELCDKDIAIKEIIHPISLALFKNINEINEESCIIILDFLVKYNYDNINHEREKLIDYAIMNSNIIIFNKVIKLLDNESQVLYKVKMQKSLLQKKHFGEAKALALETLNADENNDDSLYTLFCTYIGDKNIIEALDYEAYKLIDKVIACEKIPNKCVRKLYNEIINLDYIEGKTNALDNIIKRIKNDNELKSNLSFKIASNLKEEKHYDEAIKFYNYFIESTDTNQELGYEGLLLCKYKCEDVKKLAKSKTSFAKSNEYERLLTSANQNNNKELYRKYYDSEKIWVRNINLKRKIKISICLLVFLIVGISSIIFLNSGGEIKVITEPTETEEGIIERYLFGKKIEERTIEPLSDENYKGKITKEPTCEENGTKTYTYKRYGNKLSFTIEIPAKGHEYYSWNVDIKPTTKEPGQISRICKNDSNHIEIKELPILDNIHYSLETHKEATCTEEGKGIYTYIINDERIVFEDIMPTKDHNYINFVCNMCEKQVEYYIQDGFLYFGSYPQTVKNASVYIISNEKDENGYYTGSDGEKYALLKANPLDSYTFSNGKKIIENNKYYFKVEPIKWKILEDKNGKVFLFSELILDAHKFDDSSNDYAASSIRSWLNSDFYNKAFTDKQKELIENITLKDISNVTDKVFLLSEEEIENTSYGFNGNNNRCKKVTDYAKANHAYEYKENGEYWLRTPSYAGACNVGCYGDVYWSGVGNDYCGVAPALSFCKAKA